MEKAVGEPYYTDQKSFEGYDYVNVFGSRNGEVKEGITEVIYLYNKPVVCEDCNENPTDEPIEDPTEDPKKGKVIAHYLDIDTNAKIGVDITSEGLVGEEYKTTLRKFRGYTFVQVVGAYAGRYNSETIEVTYYYRKTEEGGTEPLDEKDKPNPTTVIEKDSKTYYTANEITIPNTGVIKNDYPFELIALIMILLGTTGVVIIKNNE